MKVQLYQRSKSSKIDKSMDHGYASSDTLIEGSFLTRLNIFKSNVVFVTYALDILHDNILPVCRLNLY
jgi:hypothetical protein